MMNKEERLLIWQDKPREYYMQDPFWRELYEKFYNPIMRMMPHTRVSLENGLNDIYYLCVWMNFRYYDIPKSDAIRLIDNLGRFCTAWNSLSEFYYALIYIVLYLQEDKEEGIVNIISALESNMTDRTIRTKALRFLLNYLANNPMLNMDMSAHPIDPHLLPEDFRWHIAFRRFVPSHIERFLNLYEKKEDQLFVVDAIMNFYREQSLDTKDYSSLSHITPYSRLEMLRKQIETGSEPLVKNDNRVKLKTNKDESIAYMSDKSKTWRLEELVRDATKKDLDKETMLAKIAKLEKQLAEKTDCEECIEQKPSPLAEALSVDNILKYATDCKERDAEVIIQMLINLTYELEDAQVRKEIKAKTKKVEDQFKRMQQVVHIAQQINNGCQQFSNVTDSTFQS